MFYVYIITVALGTGKLENFMQYEMKSAFFEK